MAAPAPRPAFQGEALLSSESSYDGLSFTGQDFSGQSGALVVIARSTLTQVNLAGTRLPRLDLDEVRMESCDLANAVWEKARLKASLVGCRMVGLNLSGALLRHTVFQGCHGAFAQFGSMVCKVARFLDCDLHGADFQQADLRSVVFQGCNLAEAQMSFARLEGTDFRGSDLKGLRVRIEDLKGAIVDPGQAVYLSGLMGLKVQP